MSRSQIFDYEPIFLRHIKYIQPENDEESKFSLYKCKCYPDGSCFFHAVLLAISSKYRNSTKSVREKICAQFRKDVAQFLQSEISIEKDGETIQVPVYNYLSRGQLVPFSKEIPFYTIENLVNLIDSMEAVGLEVVELVSLKIGINIYILDGRYNIIYNPGDVEFLYPPDRNSILLYYNHEHFDLCAIDHYNKKGEYATFFLPTNPLITYIRSELRLKNI